MATWQHWVNFVLGVWLIISAYVVNTASGMFTNLWIVGAVIGILALWGGLQESTARSNRHQEDHRHGHA